MEKYKEALDAYNTLIQTADNKYYYDYGKAITLFTNIGLDDKIVQYYLGECYYYGRGVAKNVEKSIKHFRSSSEKGYPLATARLANIFIVDPSYNDSQLLETDIAMQINDDYFQKALHQSNQIAISTGNTDPMRIVGYYYILFMIEYYSINTNEYNTLCRDPILRRNNKLRYTEFVMSYKDFIEKTFDAGCIMNIPDATFLAANILNTTPPSEYFKILHSIYNMDPSKYNPENFTALQLYLKAAESGVLAAIPFICEEYYKLVNDTKTPASPARHINYMNEMQWWYWWAVYCDKSYRNEDIRNEIKKLKKTGIDSVYESMTYSMTPQRIKKDQRAHYELRKIEFKSAIIAHYGELLENKIITKTAYRASITRIIDNNPTITYP